MKLVVLVLALGLVAGCGGESRTGEPDSQKDCGLPTPDRDVDPNAIPNEAFQMEGATIFRTQTRSGRSVVGLNVPHGVNDAFTYYRRAAKEAFEVAHETFHSDKEALLQAKKEQFALIKEQVESGVITPEEGELLREEASLQYETLKDAAEQLKDEAEAAKDEVCEAEDDER